MKVFLVLLVTLFVCTFGRCAPVNDHDYEDKYKFIEATSTPLKFVPPDDPLRVQSWIDRLTSIDKEGYARAYDPDYFKKFPGKKSVSTPPIANIESELAKLGETGTQYSLYRGMPADEAKAMGIEVGKYTPYKPVELNMDRLTGHIGHYDQAYAYAKNPKIEGNVLIEFKLKPNAQNILFSPQVAALGTASRTTAIIAETARVQGFEGYVVGKSGEGFVKNRVGLKAEGDYISLAMAANKERDPTWNDAKRAIALMTEEVTEIKL